MHTTQERARGGARWPASRPQVIRSRTLRRSPSRSTRRPACPPSGTHSVSPSSRWACGGPRRPSSRSTRRTASTAPGAPGRRVITGTRRSSARTARRRSPRRRRCGGSPRLLRRTPARGPGLAQWVLARSAGPDHPAHVSAGGRRPVRGGRLGAGLRDHRRGADRALLPDEALFYTSGRTSNEAAFLLQLFAREFGTNNLPDCSNMCHESSGSALTETIGVGKGSVSLEDLHQADLIIVAGQNPGTNHPGCSPPWRRRRRRARGSCR